MLSWPQPALTQARTRERAPCVPGVATGRVGVVVSTLALRGVLERMVPLVLCTSCASFSRISGGIIDLRAPTNENSSPSHERTTESVTRPEPTFFSYQPSNTRAYRFTHTTLKSMFGFFCSQNMTPGRPLSASPMNDFTGVVRSTVMPIHRGGGPQQSEQVCDHIRGSARSIIPAYLSSEQTPFPQSTGSCATWLGC